MQKLSVNQIKTSLLAEDEARKVKYEKMKSTTSPKRKEVTPHDPSTKITKVKQIEVPAGSKPESQKGGGIIGAGEDAGKIVDKMGRGIHGNAKGGGEPKKPAVKQPGKKPNQKTNLKQVTRQTNEDGGGKAVIHPVDDAREIIDRMERGIFKNSGGDSAERKAPSSVTKPKGEATTQPKMSQKKADMTRDPKVHVKDPVGPKSDMKMPKDAPKKPTWEKVKGGVIVEVNGKRKAQLDIVSEAVLNRMVENYESVGYTVRVRPAADVAWKKDRALFAMIRESIDAKHNRAMEYAKAFRTEAFKHFHSLVQHNMNGLYESRDEFLSVVRDAFKLVEASVEQKYLTGLEIFEGIARVVTNEGMEDVEIMTEATSPEMAVRNVRAKIAEEYGFGAEVKHIFIDGRKVNLARIAEWAPASVMEAKKEIPDFIQKKIDAKKSDSDKKKSDKSDDKDDDHDSED